MIMANNQCKECGCSCSRCVSSDHDVHLHVEIENLKQRLVERDNHIVTMETNFLNEANKFPNGELGALREELLTWQDKYKRLYEAHRRVQRVNQGLEDKLLKLVDVCETEKSVLTKDVATLSRKLADANYTIKKLTEDNERYKSDVALAIQFLQCKQTNYVSQKFDSLPHEVQAHVSTYMSNKQRKPEERKTSPEVKSIKVPIPTFPPTAMVYSVPKSPNPERRAEKSDCENPSVDIVSAAIMAKVLEERERERSSAKHCDTCTCSKRSVKTVLGGGLVCHAIGTQTGDYSGGLCSKCNASLQSSPAFAMKIVKNVAEPVKMKGVSVYANDVHIHSFGGCSQNPNNVAKVQPNNFLNNSSKEASPVNHNGSTVEVGIDLLDSGLLFQQQQQRIDSNLESKSENATCQEDDAKSLGKAAQNDPVMVELEEDNDGTNEKCAKIKRGPRYCSMRLQTGSNNILLDNAHNNVAPVLYTRQGGLFSRMKREETIKTHETSGSGSFSSGDFKANSIVSSENSAQNHERVAAWIQNNIDADLSSSENSRSDSLRNEHFAKDNRLQEIDRKRYTEMENNVKKFLFGESEFLKTVEKGKLKYQDLNNCGGCFAKENIINNKSSSRSNSHTETEI